MMHSPFEQLLENTSWAVLRKTPKVMRNLGFLLLAFVVIRLGSFVPVPGVNAEAWTEFWANSPFAQLGGLF